MTDEQIMNIFRHNSSANVWHNRKTGEAEYLEDPPVDRLEEFMPQEEACFGLFEVYQLQGMKPMDAYEKVLRTYVEIAEENRT